MARPPALVVPLLASALSGGCVHRVTVVTEPPGALVRWNGEALPADRPMIRVGPFGPRQLEVEEPGYRTYEGRLTGHGLARFAVQALGLRWLTATGAVPDGEVRVTLLREHGGIGTWNPDDLE